MDTCARLQARSVITCTTKHVLSDSIRVKTTLEIERLGVREYRGLL